MSGIQSPQLPAAITVDDVLGNEDGSTVRITITRLAAIVAALMGPTYATRAQLYADLGWSDGSIGYVRADPTTAWNGVYRKTGAIGTGNWTRIGDLPTGAIEMAELAELEQEVKDWSTKLYNRDSATAAIAAGQLLDTRIRGVLTQEGTALVIRTRNAPTDPLSATGDPWGAGLVLDVAAEAAARIASDVTTRRNIGLAAASDLRTILPATLVRAGFAGLPQIETGWSSYRVLIAQTPAGRQGVVRQLQFGAKRTEPAGRIRVGAWRIVGGEMVLQREAILDAADLVGEGAWTLPLQLTIAADEYPGIDTSDYGWLASGGPGATWTYWRGAAGVAVLTTDTTTARAQVTWQMHVDAMASRADLTANRRNIGLSAGTDLSSVLPATLVRAGSDDLSAPNLTPAPYRLMIAQVPAGKAGVIRQIQLAVSRAAGSPGVIRVGAWRIVGSELVLQRDIPIDAADITEMGTYTLPLQLAIAADEYPGIDLTGFGDASSGGAGGTWSYWRGVAGVPVLTTDASTTKAQVAWRMHVDAMASRDYVDAADSAASEQIAANGAQLAALSSATATQIATLQAQLRSLIEAARYFVIPQALRADKQIHSGHSLTLRTLWSPDNPPYLFHRLSDAGDMGSAATKIARSTILGSNSKERWEASGWRPGENARGDIDLYQVLSITEGFTRVALPYRDVSAWDAEIAQSRDYMGRFVANARTAGNGGAGAKVYLYTVWPFMDGSMGDFRTELGASEQGWHWLQDKLAADTSYRPTIIPGHRLMMRLYDDVQAGLVPGVSNFATDLFVDHVHPNAIGAYAIACLHYAVLYGVSPVGLPAIGVTVEQATYFQSAAWSVAEPYARAGLGGSDQGALGVDPSKEGTSAITTPQPLDIIPFRAVLNSNGKVVSIPNSGSAGAAHDLTAGTNTMTTGNKREMIEMRSSNSDYLILASSIDLRARRVFLPLRRDGIGSERIMGNAANEIRFVNTTAGPQPVSFFRLKLGATNYDSGVFPQSTAVALYEFELGNDGQFRCWYNGGLAYVPAPPHGVGPASGPILIYNLGRGINNTSTFNGGYGQLRTLEAGYSQAEVDAIRQSYVDFFAGALVIDTAPITP